MDKVKPANNTPAETLAKMAAFLEKCRENASNDVHRLANGTSELEVINVYFLILEVESGSHKVRLD